MRMQRDSNHYTGYSNGRVRGALRWRTAKRHAAGHAAIAVRALFIAMILALAGSGLFPSAPVVAGDAARNAPPADAPAGMAASGAPEDRFVIGTGIVIDLPGTGDSALDEDAISRSIIGVMRHAGLDLWGDRIRAGRIAKVIVTAELPRADHADVKITLIAVGDATNLSGGLLLPTPLHHTNGAVYAIAQGAVVVSNQVATVRGTHAGSGRVALVQGSLSATVD
jgi:hypothetical protein